MLGMLPDMLVAATALPPLAPVLLDGVALSSNVVLPLLLPRVIADTVRLLVVLVLGLVFVVKLYTMFWALLPKQIKQSKISKLYLFFIFCYFEGSN